MEEFVSATCEGQKCTVCGRPATNKIGEERADDDPMKFGHNLTAYLCKRHFDMVLRPHRLPPGIERRGRVTFTFEEGKEGYVTMDHEISCENFKIFEIIGLVEMAKEGMIKASHDRANEKDGKEKVQD